MSKVFFMTDTHGQLALFRAMRDWCIAQDPNCKIVFGGDAADRGRYGIEIMQELLNDEHFIYLYGNHESMFVDAADEIIGHYSQNDEMWEKLHSASPNTIISEVRRGYYVSLHMHNGGQPTLARWLELGADMDFVDKIRDLPRTYTYENIDFCHAGSTYSMFQRCATSPDFYAERQCIWDRSRLAMGWETGRICVHGHTPTTLLPDGIYGRDKKEDKIHPCAWYDKMGAKNFRGGPRIDMDTGMVWTGRAYVLDCTNFEVTGFWNHYLGASIEEDAFIEVGFENFKII